MYERTRTNDGDWAWLQAATGGVDPHNGDLYVTFEAVGTPVPLGGGKAALTPTVGPTATGPPPATPTSAPTVEPPTSDPAAAVKFLRSSDNGRTWSTPLTINDVEPKAHWGCCTFEPRMSVAPNGRIDVAWYDYRNDPAYDPKPPDGGSQNRYQDVYYSFSTDGRRAWAPNVKVTDRLIDRTLGVHDGNYGLKGPIGVVSTNDAALVAWDDTRNSVGDTQAQDIYFSRVRFPTQQHVFATGNGFHDNRLLWSLLGAAIALSLGGLVLLASQRLRRSV